MLRQIGAGLLGLALASCTSMDGGGANLGTTVIAKDNTVALRWDQKHPLDSQLQATPLRLQADYVDASGRRHSDTLANARAAAGKREILFTLPAVLNAAPKSGVCLYFLPSNDRHALPIRSVAAAGSHDTAGFSYVEWAASLAGPSAQRDLSRQIQQADYELSSLGTRAQTLATAAGKQKAPNAAACENLPLPKKAVRPADVIDPSERDTATTMLCVRRARVARSPVIQRPTDVLQRVDLALYATQELKNPSSNAAHASPESYAQRLAQARAFLADWNTYASRVGAEYQAPMGDGDESLPFNAEMDHIKEQVVLRYLEYLKQKGVQPNADNLPTLVDALFNELPPETRYSLLAGGLEAYQICLSDVRKQLQSKYEAWQYAEQRAPERLRQAHEYDVQQCKAAFTSYANASEELRLAQVKRDELQTQLGVAKAAVSPPLPAREVNLNTRTCE